MGAMQQVMPDLAYQPVGQMQYPANQAQVKVSEVVHAKFYATTADLQNSWERFLSINYNRIFSWNVQSFTLDDGSVFLFLRLRDKEDCIHMMARDFTTVDVDRDITDQTLISFAHSLLRRNYPN